MNTGSHIAGASRRHDWLLMFLAFCALGVFACRSETLDSTNALIRARGDGKFDIGLVSLDKAQRSVSIPAVVNMRDETLPVEYGVVHHTGKTHESLFRTDARPQDIQVALLLLGARPEMTNSFGADGKARPRGEEVTIEVSWTKTNEVARATTAFEDLIPNRDTRQAMARGKWIFNGSNFSEGAFSAQRDGSIISIHIDPDALINNPRPGRENDDLHVPNGAKLPPLGTPAEIRIRLLSGDKDSTHP